tara:strand:- start:55 stop:618 length:564 start_codon:yes stop_codon:yes gene_type:complete
MIWIGERTRQLDHAHIEFVRGLNNPIAIKISHKITLEEIIKLLDSLNPDNIPGKITLITRMGASNIYKYLPNLIKGVMSHNKAVIWVCDPVHANTYTSQNGFKTRNFIDIKKEIDAFFDVHKKLNSHPGGIHLELTGQNVTECIGGSFNYINHTDLSTNYKTQCDPRLNADQSLELACYISKLLMSI